MAARIDTLIDDERWAAAVRDAAALADACLAAAAALEPKIAGDAALLLTNDAALRDLNRRFRAQDKPTNVLSFPSGGGGAEGSGLGDIALAFETCRREAEELCVAFRDHARHLIVHGLLHLVGHDHEADDEAERMERLETQILATFGVADPYAADKNGAPWARR